jgi:hypothetical protein
LQPQTTRDREWKRRQVPSFDGVVLSLDSNLERGRT